jgi:hypothetical protein
MAVPRIYLRLVVKRRLPARLSFSSTRNKKRQANRQAELAARDDRDSRVGSPLQAEVPRRCLDDAVGNRLRVPLVARSDQTSPAKFGRSGGSDL